MFVPVSISSAKPIVFVLLCFNLTGKACGVCSSASLFGTGRKKKLLIYPVVGKTSSVCSQCPSVRLHITVMVDWA